MAVSQFASLTAGLLARKGEASPSKEPAFGHKPWQPPVTPATVTPVDTLLPPPLPWAPAFEPVSADAPKDEAAKVRLNEVAAAWPAPKSPHVDVDGSGWVPNKPQRELQLASLGVPFKTTIRLTHAQARAVKLAALILDKPQQEILTAGLVERLEALACADLAKCSCFHAVLEGIKAPEQPAVENGQPQT